MSPERNGRALYVPQDTPWPWFIPTPEAQRERQRILESSFFLVKIAGNGDVWRCRRCRAKHRYLTLMCIEQPFSGVTHGLYAYWHTVGLQGVESILPPEARQRYDALTALFGRGTADLATAHPQTVRRLKLDERDADVGAFALGLLEPISRRKAIQLVRAINARIGGRGKPLSVPGLSPAETE